MDDGSVFLFASTKADEETLTKIKEIGAVKFVDIAFLIVQLTSL